MSDDTVSRPLSVLEVASSTLAAAFGVQSRKNTLRDFSRGNALHFFIAGVLFTACFVAAVMGVVVLVTGGL